MNANWSLRLKGDPLPWLLATEEPWTRYRTLVDLLGRPADDVEVMSARQAVRDHPSVGDLVAWAQARTSTALKRHNDASHPLYALTTLAEFGLRASDPEMATIVEGILAHQSPEGAFQSLVNVPAAFGGTGEDTWGWMACDAPTLLYALLALGVARSEPVQAAVDHLIGLVQENGWRCAASPDFGSFRGPGRLADPCPIANVLVLKALAHVPELADSAVQAGIEMLLWHWENQAGRKLYLFGIGTDFRKPKYPLIWYDILHVLDVLSRFPHVRADSRFQEMLDALAAQADEQGRFTAASMYRPWKGWSFADKKTPSPWLTLVASRIIKRATEAA